MTVRLTFSAEHAVRMGTFAGWASDAFDYHLFSLSLPLLLAVWALSPTMAGLITSAALVGAAVGGMIGGALSDRFGRVAVLQGSIAIVAFASLACAFVTAPWQLVLLRAVQGIGFGAEWSVGAVLLAEVSPADRRGRFLGVMQSAWAVGWALAVITYLTATALLPANFAWRAMFVAGVAPAALVAWIRRSPHFIHIEKARHSEAAQHSSAFLSPRLLGAALVGLAAHGGYHSLFTWLPVLLRNVREFTSVQTGLVLLCMTAGFGGGCILAGRLADVHGRRPIIAAFGTAAVTATVVFTQITVSLLPTLLLSFAVGCAAGGVPAVLGAWFAELFPRRVRGASVGFAYNGGRLISAILPGVIGWASGFMQLGLVVGIVAAASYAAIIVLLPFLPETRSVVLSGASK